ncbi:glycerate kinase [Marinobacter sp. R17]|uniref:glycerate kinase n=1 Tax=Marinobacter sp. R17 TaxID=2484250 RepID=UPI000F4BA12A|nr:glycerate kinase [Marinobacter sp. R17]ROT98808.1 glycerate kinase [Marinobacter sp. R17]
MTHILIAPDSFKESLSASEVADAIRGGLAQALPEATFTTLPLADGGEGTMEALVIAAGGRYETTEVTGPDGNPVKARFGLIHEDRTAVIEMAEASGLQRLPQARRNPMKTTTRGTGELIIDALDLGVEQIILTLGGSATNDGGLGMAQALGVKALDAAGNAIGPGGQGLLDVSSINLHELDTRIPATRFRVICDVNNPLTGPNGATYVFGPQKGATDEMLIALDQGMARYGALLEQVVSRKLADMPGAGAAGGMGMAACAFLRGRLEPGVDVVMDAVGLREQLKKADLVITGEGRIDGQTARGKTLAGLAREAAQAGVPVVALAGSVGDDYDEALACGLTAVFGITPTPMDLPEALERAADNLRRVARNVAALYALSPSSGA